METTYFGDSLGFLLAAIGILATATVGTMGMLQPVEFDGPGRKRWIHWILIANADLATLDGVIILWKLLTEVSEVRHLAVWGTCMGIHFVAAVLLVALLEHVEKSYRKTGITRPPV